MQGKNVNTLKFREKINAFKEKLDLRRRRVKRDIFSNIFSPEMVDDNEPLIPSMCVKIEVCSKSIQPLSIKHTSQ